ncbi:cell division protein FtsN [Chania multitudinisentens RB-25]|uniref:Cell division protein FtsN n=1 Tax=Chania multitudinisentens RB-25 TaxID=1441930 RepID=W0L8I8_9GAMM|nr:cell division protein FtsN [Chania multitudinisentens]AHG20133.1 cell division protein FtsN [Chania multitudinisentens RB-25]
MAQRDYVSRGRSGAARRKTTNRKRSSPKVSKTVVALAVALLVVFIGGLYFITHNKPDDAPLLPTPGTHPSNGLPPKPEERWRYIKELENRQIGVQSPTEPRAGGEINIKTDLTDEQRQLLEQMQADMQQRPTQLSEVPANDPAQLRNNARQQQMQQQQPLQQQVSPPRNPFNNGTQSVQQQPQQSVQQPKSQVVTPPVQTRVPEPKPQPKPEIKQETAKQETKPEQKQKWMVQCGSFRATDQAESVRAQLAFEGIESRITSGGGWNRVVLGPYNSRAAADQTLTRLKGSGMSSCIPLAVGG